jgi:hypothetical protein
VFIQLQKQTKIIVSRVPYVGYYPIILMNLSLSEWHHSSYNMSLVVLALIMYCINISLKQQLY